MAGMEFALCLKPLLPLTPVKADDSYGFAVGSLSTSFGIPIPRVNEP